MDAPVYVTKHAYKRMKERCGLNKRSAYKLWERAQQNGLDRHMMTGALRKQVDAIYYKDFQNTYCTFYDQYLFLHKGKTLITVYHLPSRITKMGMEQLKRRTNGDPIRKKQSQSRHAAAREEGSGHDQRDQELPLPGAAHDSLADHKGE